jgi:hypothetical protein
VKGRGKGTGEGEKEREEERERKRDRKRKQGRDSRREGEGELSTSSPISIPQPRSQKRKRPSPARRRSIAMRIARDKNITDTNVNTIHKNKQIIRHIQSQIEENRESNSLIQSLSLPSSEFMNFHTEHTQKSLIKRKHVQSRKPKILPTPQYNPIIHPIITQPINDNPPPPQTIDPILSPSEQILINNLRPIATSPTIITTDNQIKNHENYLHTYIN